jgi:hypothetical protein
MAVGRNVQVRREGVGIFGVTGRRLLMKEYIDKSMTFGEYTALIDRLLEEGKTTGTNQSEAMVGYGRLNRARMKRLETTTVLDEDVAADIHKLDVDWIWLVITEGWCGDAAQNIPLIEKIAAANSGIETRYILRDENLELMDQYSTNGARSIPKLIAIGREDRKVLGTWGARPREAQELFYKLKSEGLEKPAIMEQIQRWYLEDKGRSIQQEFAELTAKWANGLAAGMAGK